MTLTVHVTRPDNIQVPSNTVNESHVTVIKHNQSLNLNINYVNKMFCALTAYVFTYSIYPYFSL